jgi:hypothetical protein
MCPDATTSGAQAGQRGLRPQGVLMNRKTFLFSFFGYAVMLFIILVSQQWKWIRYNYHSHPCDLVYRAIWAISASLAMIGLGLLNRGGSRIVRYILTGCYFIYVCISFALFFNRPNWDVAIGFPFYASWLIYVSPLPLALYLNHKRKQSSTESTVADAN